MDARLRALERLARAGDPDAQRAYWNGVRHAGLLFDYGEELGPVVDRDRLYWIRHRHKQYLAYEERRKRREATGTGLRGWG